MSKGILFVLSAPSGAGKTTLCRAMEKQNRSVRYSVSCTTRSPRPGEINGRDYVFLTEDVFKRRVEANEFLEWAKVHDSYYGTLKKPVFNNLKQGLDVVMDLDTQGALALKQKHPDTVCVFVTAPSWDSLEQRLRSRAQDDDKTIRKRLTNARKEMTYLPRYDYLVLNKKLEDAVDDLSAILRAEHRKLARLSEEVKNLSALRKKTK